MTSRSAAARLSLRYPEMVLAGWGFILNGAWEVLHTPLYADATRDWFYLLWTRLHCTLGDVLILLSAFWIASLIARSRFWWTSRWATVLPVFLVTGLAYTAFSEWANTRLWEGWEYGPNMPRIFGLGVTPLLQWIVLPPLAVRLLARSAAR